MHLISSRGFAHRGKPKFLTIGFEFHLFFLIELPDPTNKFSLHNVSDRSAVLRSGMDRISWFGYSREAQNKEK